MITMRRWVLSRTLTRWVRRRCRTSEMFSRICRRRVKHSAISRKLKLASIPIWAKVTKLSSRWQHGRAGSPPWFLATIPRQKKRSKQLYVSWRKRRSSTMIKWIKWFHNSSHNRWNSEANKNQMHLGCKNWMIRMRCLIRFLARSRTCDSFPKILELNWEIKIEDLTESMITLIGTKQKRKN